MGISRSKCKILSWHFQIKKIIRHTHHNFKVVSKIKIRKNKVSYSLYSFFLILILNVLSEGRSLLLCNLPRNEFQTERNMLLTQLGVMF